MTAHQVRSYGPIVTTDDRTPATVPGPTGGDLDPVPQYEIRVVGRLTARWSAWFDGLMAATDTDGTTVLRGPVADQAALHGLLQKLRDLGIPLVSLTPIPSEAPTEPVAHPTQKEN
jgi:hypothetical protein